MENIGLKMVKNHHKMEILLKQKKVVTDTLSWAINNGDRELADMYDIKLKAILKQIKQLKQTKESEQNGTH